MARLTRLVARRVCLQCLVLRRYGSAWSCGEIIAAEHPPPTIAPPGRSGRIVRIAAVAMLRYVGGYAALRQTHTEFWERDKRAYVIFPENYGRPLYYAWRPLAYIDMALTGMQHHIGPHR